MSESSGREGEAARTFAVQRCNFYIPEDEVVDFELGLYDARCPQSHSQDVRLRGHVIWRCDAGHVLEETTK